MESNLKKCSKCGEDKPLSEFSPRPERKSGYRSKCKSCERNRANNYNKNNREHVRVIQRDWVGGNRDKARAKVNKYRLTEKGKITSKKSDKKRLKSHNEYTRLRYFSDPQWNLNVNNQPTAKLMWLACNAF